MRRSWLTAGLLFVACRAAPSPAEPTAPTAAAPATGEETVEAPTPPAEAAPEPAEPAPPPESPVPPRRLATGGIYNCVVRGGEVYCWGLDRNHPPGEAFHVALDGEAVEVAAGRDGACARLRGGGVTCWNESATLPVAEVTRAVSIGVGSSYACAAEPEGVCCWTPNFRADEPPVVRPVFGVEDPIAVAAGYYHACALERGGTVKCWGRDEQGALGADDAPNIRFSEGTANDDDWVALRFGRNAKSLDLDTFWERTRSLDRELLGCVRRVGGGGDGSWVEFGLDVDAEGVVTDVKLRQSALGEHAQEAMARCVSEALFGAPALVPEDKKAVTVGVLVAFASRGAALRHAHPVIEDAVHVASRGYFSCAALKDGTVECWGITHGFDGPGIHGMRLESPGRPGVIEGLEGVQSMSVGWRHVCGRRADGSHVCAGGNADGSFGPDAPVSDQYGVSDIDKARHYVEISAGPTLTCGLRADESVWCWGINDGQRLGTGDETPGPRPPAPVVGLPSL